MHNSLRFEFQLAWRFLAENKGQSLLIALGITIGVAVMVFLTALIDGLQVDLIENTVGHSPHIVVSSAETASLEALKSFNGQKVLTIDTTKKDQRPIGEWHTLESAFAADQRIRAVLPVVDGTGLIRRGQVTRSVLLRGFDLALADQLYDITNSIVSGNRQPISNSVLMGKDLAADLGIQAGDPISLELPGQTPLVLIVDGIFDLGVSAINQRWLVIDQRLAASLLGIGDQVTSFELQVHDVFLAEQITEDWGDKMPGYQFDSWQKTNASLLTALKSQSSSSYTIQFFVLLAVILGVASVLAISAVQKSKEIGILKAMGIRTGSVSRVFMLQGLTFGIAGSIAGFGLGLLLTKLFIKFAGPQLSLLLKPSAVCIILGSTLLAATLSAYVPARQVSKLNPIEVIRNG